ncbi:hypothetical protein CQA37_05365 [Helicobacter sp. MIT 99-10781]|uniref:hypothetical protein n=1 Tax=unclassified Helicobacter TaxID=2593540 RepID=UPI000E3B4E08|nr:MULTISPECIES: hypothetical protein [unclassified Helicobacter]RDU54335.1 hypothetical protein CQA37_05365 [Helicobacter sp. MIT 99-10781]
MRGRKPEAIHKRFSNHQSALENPQNFVKQKKVLCVREAGNKAEFISAKLEAERSFGFSQSDSLKGIGEAEFTSAQVIQFKGILCFLPKSPL